MNSQNGIAPGSSNRQSRLLRAGASGCATVLANDVHGLNGLQIRRRALFKVLLSAVWLFWWHTCLYLHLPPLWPSRWRTRSELLLSRLWRLWWCPCIWLRVSAVWQIG